MFSYSAKYTAFVFKSDEHDKNNKYKEESVSCDEIMDDSCYLKYDEPITHLINQIIESLLQRQKIRCIFVTKRGHVIPSRLVKIDDNPDGSDTESINPS